MSAICCPGKERLVLTIRLLLTVSKGWAVMTPEQVDKATSLQRCLFTHNRLHYEELHREAIAGKKKHFGIIIGSRRNVYESARRIATLLNTLTADEIENQIFYV